MRESTLKTEFWIAFVVWVVSIALFFNGLSKSTVENAGNIVALVSFIVGSVSFLYGLNKLALIVNNMRKLRKWSVIIWIMTILVFAISVWDSSKYVEHQIFRSRIWGGFVVGDIMLGIASFISVIASFSAPLPKKSLVEKGKEKGDHASTGLSSKISDELDDIIFIPKRKQGAGVGVILAGVLVLGLLAINAIGGESGGATQSPQPSVVATLSQLSLVDPKIVGNNTQSLTGTIKNSSRNIAVDVVIRVDFSKDKEAKQQFDTRYFPIDYVAANGAYTFNIPFDLNYRGQYWWNAKIETAEFK